MARFAIACTASHCAGRIYTGHRALPPRRASSARVTQRVVIDGEVRELHSPILHDDRKPLERWVASQLSYSALEAQRIVSRDSYRFRDRLRELGVMPVIAGALAYIRAGGPFRGAAAVRYAYERAAYESLLAIRLMSLKLEAKQKTTTEAVPLQTPKLTDPDAEQAKSEVRSQRSKSAARGK